MTGDQLSRFAANLDRAIKWGRGLRMRTSRLHGNTSWHSVQQCFVSSNSASLAPYSYVIGLLFSNLPYPTLPGRTMSQDSTDDNSLAQQVDGLVQGAIQQHLNPLVELPSPLVAQLQARRETDGGESSNPLPLTGMMSCQQALNVYKCIEPPGARHRRV